MSDNLAVQKAVHYELEWRHSSWPEGAWQETDEEGEYSELDVAQTEAARLSGSPQDLGRWEYRVVKVTREVC